MAQAPIPFNRPTVSGNEEAYLTRCFRSGHWSGDGAYSREAQALLESKGGFRKALLTPSCTAALEMAAILCRVGPGDEVIIPSYTFPSTATAFVLRGAKPVFVDSLDWHPNLDADQLEALVTPRTRVLAVVHYAGMACDMDRVLDLARRRELLVVEDAAQGIDSRFRDRPLGSLGHLGALSFHETKNITCGEGGALLINDPNYVKRAEIIREKGTNRSAFFRGEVDKYGWVDIGSSYLPSDLSGAILLGQLEQLEAIQARRVAIWHLYHQALAILADRGNAQLPVLPPHATLNGHMYYLVVSDLETRTRLLAHARSRGAGIIFHYQSLHRSSFFRDQHDGRPLPQADRYSNCLVRLPLFRDLTDDEVDWVAETVLSFYR
jgi:dTDP-4-amino-4,6-dideoxygalactose transaminase